MADYEFNVGDGVSVCFFSDRYPATVIDVHGKRVTIRWDRAIVVKGSEQDGSVEYRYEPNPNGIVEEFSRRNNNVWVRVGDSNASMYRIAPGRGRYHDPHF